MSTIIMIIALAGICGFYATTLLIWESTQLWGKISSIFIVIILVVGTYFGGINILSQPKPVDKEYERLGKGYIVSSIIEENVAIYLWVTFDDTAPAYYVIPWDRDVAEELQEALNESSDVLFLMFDHDWVEDDKMFHPVPQPKLIPKQDEQQEPPRNFDHET